MYAKRLKTLAPPILAIGVIVIGLWFYAPEGLAVQCFSIYKDILPEGAQIAEIEDADRELTVHYKHRDGKGKVLCFTNEDGSLDDVASTNLKIDLMWDNPEIVPRL